MFWQTGFWAVFASAMKGDSLSVGVFACLNADVATLDVTWARDKTRTHRRGRGAYGGERSPKQSSLGGL